MKIVFKKLTGQEMMNNKVFSYYYINLKIILFALFGVTETLYWII